VHALTTFDFLIRLATGTGCGAVIGVERQWRARMAGLRTNALVATGATLFVLYGGSLGSMDDATRIAAYVVSGIGFLGGGVILRDGASVRGLNTAATLWCSAATGVMAASGHLVFAWIGAAAVLVIHLVLRPAGRLIDRFPQDDPDTEGTGATVHLVCERKAETHVRALLLQALAGSGLTSTGLRATREGEDTTSLRATVAVSGDPARALEQLIARLSLEPGIRDLHWHLDDGDDSARPGRPALA
jgi:putative Mg2+ transporter-C (MgtC) family protein